MLLERWPPHILDSTPSPPNPSSFPFPSSALRLCVINVFIFLWHAVFINTPSVSATGVLWPCEETVGRRGSKSVLWEVQRVPAHWLRTIVSSHAFFCRHFVCASACVPARMCVPFIYPIVCFQVDKKILYNASPSFVIVCNFRNWNRCETDRIVNFCFTACRASGTFCCSVCPLPLLFVVWESAAVCANVMSSMATGGMCLQ